MSVTYEPAVVTNGMPPMTTVCAPASGSIFQVAKTTITCTATDAARRTSSCVFVVTVTPPPTLTLTRFVAFGDSITWGQDGTEAATSGALRSGKVLPRVRLPTPETYPGALQQALVERYTKDLPTVDNAGLPLESVTRFDTRARFLSLVGSSRYDVVLIMEGSNDVPDPTITDSLIIAGLHQMILDARNRGVRPYLATIPPMNPAGFRAGGAGRVPSFNNRVRDLAASDGVTLVDVHAALNADIGTYIGFDGLHPTAAGFAKIASLFFEAIRQTLEQQVSAIPTGAFPRRTDGLSAPASTGRDSGVSGLRERSSGRVPARAR